MTHALLDAGRHVGDTLCKATVVDVYQLDSKAVAHAPTTVEGLPRLLERCTPRC